MKTRGMKEWINVEDKLPIQREDVPMLVYSKYEGIVVRVWNGFYKSWDLEDGDDHFTETVGGKITHWMELPEKP